MTNLLFSHPRSVNVLLCRLLYLVLDDALNGTFADGTESLGSIVAHTAYVRRAVDALRAVTATFVYAYGVVLRAL